MNSGASVVTDRGWCDARIRLCAGLLHSLAAQRLDAERNALYLWGSVLSDDFRPGASDVDVLLVAVAATDLEAAGSLAQAARRRHALLEKLDLVTLCLGTVRGRRRRPPFDRIHPRVLLAQADSWVLVWGSDTLLAGLRKPPETIGELVRLRRGSLRRRLRLHALDPEDEPLQFILKEGGFVCHLLHQARLGAHPFSYATLRRHADHLTGEMVELLLEARAANWTLSRPEQVLAAAHRLCRV